MFEYMTTIGFSPDFDRNVLTEIFQLFDDDDSGTIDKQEMFEFINILLSRKDDVADICETESDHL